MGHEVNAVFEGGGAKGVAYVGALRASEQAGLTFAAAAGSSAGAITAALVACGYTSTEIEPLMQEALRSFGGRVRALVGVHRRSLLSSEGLRRWLVRSLDAKLAGDGGRAGAPAHDWTFAELHERTGRCLYVVTTDLGDRQPLVFSPWTTPDASIVDAVVASCAIPVAFPAQRVIVGEEIHRLVDGGVWANYPSFVFLDDDFRTYHDVPSEDPPRRTVGFILHEGPLDDRCRSWRACGDA
jgi:NTE family protein